MNNLKLPNPDNPSEIAENVAQKFNEKGYDLDFSILSLKNEIDLILKNQPFENSNKREILEAELTAYFGETICRVFNAQWGGTYLGPMRHGSRGNNYYLCKIIKGDFEIWPSHFFSYYFSNGSNKEYPFKDYMEFNYYSIGNKEYVDDGILKKLEKFKT